MSVQLHLLEPKMVNLLIGNLSFKIGTLRRFWKVTEMTDERERDVEQAKLSLNGTDAPLAAMVVDISDIPLCDTPGTDVSAHVVLGWDADRYLVADWDWDFLPVLGYAVRETSSNGYALHELQNGTLFRMTPMRAISVGIIDEGGRLRRCGQPTISSCQVVEPYLSNYVQAKCTLSDGRTAELLTRVGGQHLPESGWYIGKRPADITTYT
jgi:hypothetical protein